MTSPDSTSHNQDPEQTEGVGRDGLDVTSNYSGSGALDATGEFDSKTRPQAADATAAFDSKGVPVSGSGSFHERMRSSNSNALIGSVIGGYRIVSALGQGGMGRVFRADDSSGRPVAIKLLSPDLARSSEALARFKQEGLIASQINHSRCVFVHRVDEDAGTPFIAMELMTGQTLKDLVIQKGPLPFAEAVRLILQCIEGLVEAHSRGMIHRDIKPANCYLDSHGNVKIGDFGLARSLVSDSELTQTGAFIGTPLFASPEQLLGQNIDVQSDIYSLTATLYFLLAGKAPFESPHAAQVIARIASSDPPPFSTVEIEVPDELERIVMKGLSRDPSKRYQSFVEMQTELMALLAPKPETATVVRRVIAALADHFLLSILTGTISLLLLPKWIIEDSKIVANLFGAGITGIYFLLAESIFATSLGKAAMRIHIADARTGRKPSVARILVRVLAFTAVSVVIEVVFFAILYATGWIQSDIVQGLTIALASPLTWMLYFVTWRNKGRRQMLHDWLSKTECLIPAPPVIQNTELEIPNFELPVVKSQTPLPETLGRFRVRNQIDVPGADNSIRWLNGDDPALERCVWIAVTNDTEIDYEQQQCTKDPSTRLRFIEQGIEGSQRWYAYVAPEGIPLRECLSHGVHFAWPVTSFVFRQLLNHFHSVKNTNLVASISKLSDWWIDRAGRLSIVSLDSAVHKDPPAACVEQIQSENATNYRELIQSVSLLALPKNHRLRKKYCKQKTGGQHFCLLAREDLPPLRSLNFCESIACGKYMPSLQTLESQLVQLNRGSHCVTSKTRFFNAILSVAFSVPLLSAIAFLLLFPAIIHIVNVRNNVQKIATLNYVAQTDAAPDSWWKGASDQQRSYWTSEVGRQKIGELEVKARKRLADVYANLGKFERSIVNNIPSNSELLEPPLYHLPKPKTKDPKQEQADDSEASPAESNSVLDEDTTADQADSGEATSNAVRQRRSRSGFNFSLPGNRTNWAGEYVETWDEDLLSESLAIANADNVELNSDDRISEKFIYAGVGIVGLLALWNWLTFGGMSTRLTGICFVNRDGTRMGILKSGLRSIIIFAPALVLLVLLANWPIVSIRDLWWTNQIKLLLIFSPLGYLASTLIWNNRTVADIFSGTTSIPR